MQASKLQIKDSKPCPPLGPPPAPILIWDLHTISSTERRVMLAAFRRCTTARVCFVFAISTSGLGFSSPRSGQVSAKSYKKHYHSTASVQVRAMQHEDPLIYSARENQTASVIVIHGLGDSGAGWFSLGPEIGQGLPYAKFIFPTALELPVSLNNGMKMTAWHDLRTLDTLTEWQDIGNIRNSASYIQSLVEKEMEAGIPSHRIVVAGFSQGGATAYHSLRQPHKLGGVVVMSGYLNLEKEPLFSQANKDTPLLICHGEVDQVVMLRYGREAHEQVKSAGINVTFKTYPYSGHTLDPQEAKDVEAFLEQQLPRT